MTYKIQIDNFLFNVVVSDYSPAIPGTWDKRADNPDEFYGVPLTLNWECKTVIEAIGDYEYMPDTLNIITGDDALEIVDAYAEQITEQLLDKIKFEQECDEEVW